MEQLKDEMQLKDVLASILQALQEAKRMGDLQSSQLIEFYKREKSLSCLTVPAFDIAEIDLDLRFAVAGLSEKGPKFAEVPGLNVNVTSSALKGLDPSQVQIMKIKIRSASLRAFEESEEG